MVSLFRRTVSHVRRRQEERFLSKRGPIYLVAAAGQPNFGDEFITRAWLDWLAKHHPKREVWLDCMEPGRAAHLFADTHPRLKTTNTLWQLAHMGGPDDISEAAARIDRFVTELGSPKVDFGLRTLRNMSSVHLLGGGFINALWPRNLGIVAAMASVKRNYGVRVYATGQGLLPCEGATRRWLREQLATFDYAESRDAYSAEAFDIVEGTDDAFLAFANDRPIYAPAESAPMSMVLVQGDMPEYVNDEWAEATISSFVEQQGGVKRVGFAEGIPPEDSRFAGDWVTQGAEFYPFMRIWEEGFPAREGQTWLTTRFHFHLLAAAAGAAGAALDIRPGYYDVKHDLLRKLKTGWTDGAPTTGDDIATGSSGEFPGIARRLGEAKAALASRLYA